MGGHSHNQPGSHSWHWPAAARVCGYLLTGPPPYNGFMLRVILLVIGAIILVSVILAVIGTIIGIMIKFALIAAVLVAGFVALRTVGRRRSRAAGRRYR